MRMNEPVPVPLSSDHRERIMSVDTHGTRNAMSDFSKNDVMMPTISQEGSSLIQGA